MPPIDSETGKPWSAKTTKMAHDEIRASVTADLKARDEARGIPPSGQVYTTAESDPERPGRLDVDPVLAAKKHTGAEHKALVLARWAKFCEIPRSEKEFIAQRGGQDAEKKRAEVVAAAADVEKSIAEETGTATVVEPPKRKRGRPSKADIAAREAAAAATTTATMDDDDQDDVL